MVKRPIVLVVVAGALSLGAVALAQSAAPLKNVQTVTLAGERVAAEVTGTEGGPVVVSGTIGLSTATLNTMIGPTCVPSEYHRIAVTGTPIVIPVIDTDRTEMMIHNVSTGSISLSCRPDPGDGGVPDCDTPGFGMTIHPADSVTLGFKSSVTIRCRTCPSGTGTLEHMDVTCTGS